MTTNTPTHNNLKIYKKKQPFTWRQFFTKISKCDYKIEQDYNIRFKYIIIIVIFIVMLFIIKFPSWEQTLNYLVKLLKPFGFVKK